MKKVSKKAYILSLLPAIIMMITIFVFSSKTAVESDGSSLGIANKVLQVYEGIFGAVATENKPELLRQMNQVIRKIAHVTEYMVLAISLGIHFMVVRSGAKRYLQFNIGICVLYAMTDEFHQLFVEGRSGQLTDVLIDSSGIVLGTVLLLLLFRKQFINH